MNKLTKQIAVILSFALIFSTTAPIGYQPLAAAEYTLRISVDHPINLTRTDALALMDDITIGLEARVEDALTVKVQELERELRLQPNITQVEKEAAIAELRDEIEAKILDEQKVDRFIVKYKTGHEPSFLQKTQTAEHIELVEAKNGGILSFWQPTQGDIELITLPEKVNPAEYAAELSEIGADADIEYIQPDYKLEFAALDGLTDEWAQESDEQAQVTNEQESDESLESIDESSESIAEESTEAVEPSTPENAVIVALIDTGVDITHPDLANKFWNNGTYSAEDDTLLYGWNFIDDNAVVYDEDLGLDQAHGTHIAGIIAGLSDADDALTANRDSVRLMVLKAFEGGSAYTSDIIEAITFADTSGAQIINCSWGSTAYNQALYDAMAASPALFVCAAGNARLDIDTTPVYPAAFDLDNIISVGGVNQDGGLAYFSNFGAVSVDIGAPSRDIESTLPVWGYGPQTGTSMAAGVVSGAAAVLANGESSGAEDIKEWLIAGADKISPLVGRVKNAARLNIEAAAEGVVQSELQTVETTPDFGADGYSAASDEWQLYSGTSIVSASLTASAVLLHLSDGTVWGWGSGQTGRGTASVYEEWGAVLGLTDVAQLVAQDDYALALKDDGTVWGWGSVPSVSGNTTMPTQIMGLTNVSEISAGGPYSRHVLALADGEVWAWGDNSYGQLGNGTNVSSAAPVQVSGLTDIMAIWAGYETSFALDSSGTMWTWGKLGLEYPYPTSTIPQEFEDIDNVVDFAFGYYHILALDAEQNLWAWGDNYLGQLGDESAGEFQGTPIQVPDMNEVVKIAASGQGSSFAIKSDGSVWGWGDNFNAQLGSYPEDWEIEAYLDSLEEIWDGSLVDYLTINTPTQIVGLPESLDIVGNWESTLVLGTNGKLYGFGGNSYGVLDNANLIYSIQPLETDMSGIVEIATSRNSGLALTDSGNIYGWGNIYSDLYTYYGSVEFSVGWEFPTPELIWDQGGVQDIASDFLGYFIKDGMVYYFENPESVIPLDISDVAGIKPASYSYPSFVWKEDGTLWGWGYARYGELGPNVSSYSETPVQIDITQIKAADAGYRHCIALKTDGTVWTWGTESYGGTSTPTQVPELSNVQAIAAGSGYCLALLDDGTVWSWGDNYMGALGLGDSTARTAPTQIPDLTDVVAISAVSWSSMALKADGTVWEWGTTPSQALGNTEVLSPVQVTGLYDVTAIAAGYAHSLAISDGVVLGWGDNTYDDLGIARAHHYTSPKEIWVRIADDYSDKREDATALTGSATGLLQHTEDKDWFSFTPASSQTFNITLTDPSDQLSVLVYAGDNLKAMNTDYTAAAGTGVYSVSMNAGTSYAIKVCLKKDAAFSQEISYDIQWSTAEESVFEPVLAIPSADLIETFTEPTIIAGTVSGDGVVSYILEYAWAGDTFIQDVPEEDVPFVQFAAGSAPIADDTLGILGTTSMANGYYLLRLTAFDDDNSQSSSVTRTILVEGRQKSNFSTQFIDMELPVRGMPLTAIRAYDSRQKHVSGDFGYGWNLGMSGATLTESGIPGDGWNEKITSSLFFSTYTFTEAFPHAIIIDWGNGRTEKFIMRPDPYSQSIIPITWINSIGYQAQGNSKSALTALDQPEGFVYNGNKIYDYNIHMYNPSRYKLTKADGTYYIFDDKKGVREVHDPAGNSLEITSDGIYHSNGQYITITRDSQDRVTSIESPGGRIVTYSYDSAGNLADITDALGNVTEFVYDSEHYLLEVISPTGDTLAYNEYDAEGRLAAIVDADGNRVEIAYDIAGRQEVVTNRLGNSTVYEYDNKGNVIKITDSLGGVTTNTYNSYNLLASTTDPLGRTTTYEYGNDGKLTKVTDALGRISTATYDTKGQITGLTATGVQKAALTYNTSGRLTQLGDALSANTALTYDSAQRLTGVADQIGAYRTYTYDGAGNVISSTDAAGSAENYTYGPDGNLLTRSYTAVSGGVTKTVMLNFGYDADGNITEIIYPDGNTELLTYDEIGNLISRENTDGQETHYSYDLRGNMTGVAYDDGTTETFVYDAENNLITAVNRLGQETAYVYDSLNRLVEKTNGAGGSVTYEYDAVSNMTAMTNEYGGVYEYEYDSLNRNTAVTDPLGGRTEYTYNNLSLIASIEDAKGNITAFQYNNKGERTAATFPDGTAVSTAYDARGRITSQTDQNGYVTAYTYNNSDALTSVTDALSNTWTYAYDGRGNLTSVTDPLSRETAYQYDEFGRRIKTTLANGADSAVEYDDAAREVTKTDFSGDETLWTFDSEGRLLSAESASDIIEYTYGPGDVLATVSFNSDETEYEYDESGSLSKVTYPDGSYIEYEYDVAYQLAEVATPYGSTAYEYDEMGRLAKVSGSEGDYFITYDENGNRAILTYPSGVTAAYVYSDNNALIGETVTDALSNTLASYAYTVGDAGERLTIVENGGRSVAYAYDALYRLTQESVTTGGSTVSTVYAYDAVSNRVGKTVGAAVTAYTYNSLNQLVSETSGGVTYSYAYDADGNRLSRSGGGESALYVYDEWNQLIEAEITLGGQTVSETYEYDYEGNRIAKITDGVRVNYLVDANNWIALTLAETDAGGDLLAWYTRETDAALGMVRGADMSYYHYDGSGDVRFLTDGSGAVTDTYTFDAWGNVSARTGTTENEYLANGEQYDQTTSLYYLRARYMEPGTGTFLSMDQSAGSEYDPPSLHKYLYANANPVMYSDPTGYFSLSELITAMQVQAILSGVNLFPMVAAYGWTLIAMNDTAIEELLRLTPVALGFDAMDLLWDVLNWGQDSELLKEHLGQTALDAIIFIPIVKLFDKISDARRIIRGIGKIPTWKGSGPVAGVLGVNAKSPSIAAIRNYYPKNGAIEFIFDPKTNTFLVGGEGSHALLAKTINADQSTVVGGIFRRGSRGEFLTNEASGHFHTNWNPEIREQFKRVMANYGLPVIHTVGI